MKKIRFYILQVIPIYFLVLPGLSAQSVSGHVDAPLQVKQLVVYLQSDAKHDVKPKIHAISQKDTTFHSPINVITAGDSVQWRNDENKEIDHNVFSLSPLASFDLGLGEKGSKLEQVFNNIGVVNYYCSVHKNMEGKIIVLPDHYYQVLEQPGDFLIENVPEGNWTLNAVVLHLRYKAEPIKLAVGKTPLTNLTLRVIKK